MPNLFTNLDLTTDLYNLELQQTLPGKPDNNYVQYIEDTGSVDSNISTNEDLLPARIIFIRWLLVIPLCEGQQQNSNRFESRRKDNQESPMEPVKEEDYSGSLSGDLNEQG